MGATPTKGVPTCKCGMRFRRTPIPFGMERRRSSVKSRDFVSTQTNFSSSKNPRSATCLGEPHGSDGHPTLRHRVARPHDGRRAVGAEHRVAAGLGMPHHPGGLLRRYMRVRAGGELRSRVRSASLHRRVRGRQPRVRSRLRQRRVPLRPGQQLRLRMPVAALPRGLPSRDRVSRRMCEWGMHVHSRIAVRFFVRCRALSCDLRGGTRRLQWSVCQRHLLLWAQQSLRLRMPRCQLLGPLRRGVGLHLALSGRGARRARLQVRRLSRSRTSLVRRRGRTSPGVRLDLRRGRRLARLSGRGHARHEPRPRLDAPF